MLSSEHFANLWASNGNTNLDEYWQKSNWVRQMYVTGIKYFLKIPMRFLFHTPLYLIRSPLSFQGKGLGVDILRCLSYAPFACFHPGAYPLGYINELSCLCCPVRCDQWDVPIGDGKRGGYRCQYLFLWLIPSLRICLDLLGPFLKATGSLSTLYPSGFGGPSL